MTMRALLAVMLLATTGAWAQAPAKIKTLLITGGPVGGHDWQTVSPLLKKALEGTGRFDVRVTEDFRGAGAETLAGYDLVVVNYSSGRDKEWTWGERAQGALADYVKSGKGLVMFHFSVASFLEWPEWEKLSGGNWRPNQGHHSPSHDFDIDVKDPEHPIMRGLKAKFRQRYDELYANLKWQPEGSYHVLATAWDDHKLYQGKARQPIPGDGIHQPMLWTMNYGGGRIFATMLGHDGPAVKTDAFVVTFTRGAEWAATGAVTLAVPASMSAAPAERVQPEVVTPGVAGSAPSDAVALFNGKDMTGWVRSNGSPSGCAAVKGEMVCRTGAGDAVTERKFKSAQFHVEVQIPSMPSQKDQLKGNSGIYLQALTEVQVLDSYQNPTYPTGIIGAVYDQYAPLKNAARKPGEWTTYDIVFHAPECNARAQELKPARLTVILNGVLVQDNVELRFQPKMCEAGPLLLQDHSGFPGAPDTTMKFRNVWARELQ